MRFLTEILTLIVITAWAPGSEASCSIQHADRCCRDKDCNDNVNDPDSKWCHLADRGPSLYSCFPKRHEGEDCWRDRMCASGACGSHGTCLGHEGSPCLYHQTGGAHCSQDCDCQSGRCSNSRCVSPCPYAKLQYDELCNRDCECQSNDCKNGRCQCGLVHTGKACTRDSDCCSAYCESTAFYSVA